MKFTDKTKKTPSGWQHMSLQNLYEPFSINGAFTDVTVTHDAMDTNTSSQMLLLKVVLLLTLWTVLFLFRQEDTTFRICKNI